MATGKSYAPDVFATVSNALTTYARNWANMFDRIAKRPGCVASSPTT